MKVILAIGPVPNYSCLSCLDLTCDLFFVCVCFSPLIILLVMECFPPPFLSSDDHQPVFWTLGVSTSLCRSHHINSKILQKCLSNSVVYKWQESFKFQLFNITVVMENLGKSGHFKVFRPEMFFYYYYFFGYFSSFA